MSNNIRHRRNSHLIFKKEPIYAADQYTDISKDELVSLIGSDSITIHKALSANFGEYIGLKLPESTHCTSGYLADVILGLKRVLTIEEGIEPSIPTHSFFDLKYLVPEFSKYPDLLAMMPERYHRNGDGKDLLILEDHKYMYMIFSVVRPAEFKAFYDQQEALHKAKTEDKEKSKLRAPTKLIAKLRAMGIKPKGKGKTGQLIVNVHRNANLKRKRHEQMQAEVAQTRMDDKVYFPDGVMDNNVYGVQGKDYIPITSYREVLDAYKKQMATGTDLKEATKKLPWLVSLTMQDEAHAIAAYDLIKGKLEQSTGWDVSVIPSLWEAKGLYANRSF